MRRLLQEALLAKGISLCDVSMLELLVFLMFLCQVCDLVTCDRSLVDELNSVFLGLFIGILTKINLTLFAYTLAKLS